MTKENVDNIFQKIVNYETFNHAYRFLEDDNDNTTKEQIELCQVAAPTFMEENRAKLYKKKFEDLNLQDVHIDGMGNVLGTIKGSSNNPKLLVAAHLDTVFPIETDVTVNVKDGILHAPGIADDTRGLAEILTMIRAINESGLTTVGDIIFCGNVCEEGLGDLKGVRYIFENRDDIDGFITIDGTDPASILYTGTGSRRYKITYKGCGGHSLGDFGMPNPIHALGRAISKISDFQIPDNPKTTFNVGLVDGGTSINSIAYEASMHIDMRSNSPQELKKLEEKMLESVELALEEENNRWGNKVQITLDVDIIGSRPAAEQSPDESIVKAALTALSHMDIEPEVKEYGSTDANIPLSMGIPAICLGSGGESGNIHNLEEWFNPHKAFIGPQKTLLTILSLVGVDNLTEPLL